MLAKESLFRLLREMDNTGGRPAKRHRKLSPSEALPDVELKDTPTCDTEKLSANDSGTTKSKYKSKRLGTGSGSILNTIETGVFNSKNKRAISVSELKSLKEQSKNTSKTFTSIIDLRDESDTSMNGGSSPFKIIRSSQDFNLDATTGPTATNATHQAAVITPKMLKARPSSDDGIFWVTTPSSNNNHSFDVDDLSNTSIGKPPKLPSSPLKNEHKDFQLKDLPDTLLDPEVKTLLSKFNPTKQKRKFGETEMIPTLSRANSDSQALSSLKPALKRNPGSTQIIATKSSINESLLKSIQRREKSSHRNEKENTEQEALDFSDILAQLGSKLRGDDTHESSILVDDEVENPQVPITMEATTTSKSVDEESSDAFSDDIDFSAIEMNATQAVSSYALSRLEHAPAKAPAKALEEEDSEDNFSDDDDDLMEKIELGLTQQTRTNRSTTEQTDVTYIGETDAEANDVTSIIKGMAITETENTKYKGMVTVTNERISEDSCETSKPFQLYDENDNLAKSALKFDLMKRLQIKGVQQGLFTRKNVPEKQRQVILKCITADDNKVNIMVRDEWATLEFKVNDVIHIIMKKKIDNFQVVDKDQNLLIWNPDTLLSATRIADAISCKRKSIISQKFNGPGIVSVPFILGNIVHSLFQKCLLHKRVDDEFADEIIEDELNSHVLEIYAADKTKEELKSVVVEHFSYIKDWIDEYVPMKGFQTRSKFSKNFDFKATKILDIEENIMSPIFGIRGLIDVVIEARLRDGKKFVVPLEIKTGQQYTSNSAQVSLYTLLVKQRYGVESMNTSLVYTKLHKCCLDAVTQNDLKVLVNIRNILSQYLAYAVTDLPPILGYKACERCFSLEPCMVLNKMVEGGDSEKSGIDPDKYDEIAGSLNDPRYKEFYTHWDKLITKEEGLLNFTKTDLWRNSAETRESNGGNCVGSLRVVKCDFSKEDNKFVYLFERDPTVYAPLTASQLSKNDRIILSDGESMFGLTWGYVKLIRPDYIVIMTDRNWSNSAVKMADFNEVDNQTFRSVLRTTQTLGGSQDERQSQTEGAGQFQALSSYITAKMYRIDKDQMFHGMAMARYNLLNLFLPGGASKNRELIVELRPPKFNDLPNFQYSRDHLDLNDDQMHAVDTVSKMDDYALILGMPGTGKTTLISSIISCIVKNDMTVLITSYTHSAVDNICEKLIKTAKANDEDLSLLRVGSTSRVSPIVQPYSMYGDNFIHNIKDKDKFETVIANCQIVATTCLGINDIVFGMGKSFDYCIIDEASQVALPIVLGPMSFADKFVLVGDHYQLPPLVIHPEARQEGLDQSLFKMLSEKHPNSVCELTHQYRMCSDIMSLSNELIYAGRLKCGSEAIANQMLKMPYLETLPIRGTCINEIIRPERRVVFVNEDDVRSIHEVSFGDKIENPGEAKLISIVIKSMLLSGVQQENIGVMSFYKAQLRHFFRELIAYPEIEILTADRFQGRDKDVIIISLVRSEVLGELLKEWRRVNVAMTRAKCKLIIFGSKKLLESSEQFEGFMDLIKSKGWYYDLKDGDEKIADGVNFFDHEAATTAASQSNVLNHYSTDPMESQTDVKRLDHKSRAIRHTKILKYVIDEATK